MLQGPEVLLTKSTIYGVYSRGLMVLGGMHQLWCMKLQQ